MHLLMIHLLAAAPPMPVASEAPAASAAPRATVELNWTAPEECPTAAAIREEIDHRLSDMPPLGQPIVADAQVRRVPEGLVLDLRLHVEGGDDRVRHYLRASCRDLGDMAVDEICSVFPAFRAREDEASPVPAPPPAAPAKQPMGPAPSPRKLAGAVRLGGMVGGQPGGGEWAVLGGPLLSLALLGPRWRLEATGLYLKTDELSYSIRRDDVPQVSIAWQVAAGQLTGCGAPVARTRVELHLCGGGEMGGIFGKLSAAQKIDDSRGSSRLWFALHAGPMISIRLRRNVYLWASGTGVIAFPQEVRVDVATTGVATSPTAVDLGVPWLQLRGALGMEIRWGR